MTDVLTRRALNRATLARQLLLTRHRMPAEAAVHRLAGLNAQNADSPYVSLAARLTDFRPELLADSLHGRQVVRACLMRYTQHLVTADDLLVLRPVLTPVLARVQRSAWGSRTAGVDLDELVRLATTHLRGVTRTRPELGRLLARRWPEHEGSALAWSAQYLMALVHPPPDGLWGRRGGHTPLALAEDWLGRPLAPPDPARLIRRYLAAFGPASVRDVHAWSGLSRLGDELAKLDLRQFRTDTGGTVYDLPDAPRPDPETVAPPRFLPAFDNLVLAHHDRTRIITDEHRRRVCVGAAVAPTLLVDGMVHGTWQFDADGGLDVELFAPLPDEGPVRAEALGLLELVAPEGSREVRFTSARPVPRS